MTTAVSDWRPIETAPKDRIVLLGQASAVFDGWWSPNADGWVDGCTNTYDEMVTYKPTHWMPLPESPL